jgi:primosomal protein N' (replication factor Y) (superfamily II helicase)
MLNKKIAKVILTSVLNKEFDYTYCESLNLEPGTRVLIDFRGRKQLGLVYSTVSKSNFKNLKPILEVLDTKPLLTKEHFEFSYALSKLYPYESGEFLFMMLPPFLKIKKKYNFDLLNEQKSSGIDARIGNFNKNPRRLFVKADYFRQRYGMWKDDVQGALKEGSVLICFPQLSYLLQAKRILEKDFGQNVTILHSKLKNKEFMSAWARSRGRTLILGTRVSLFYYPLDLKLLIVEEENSPYYFQEEKPYHRLFDAARLLCDLRKVDLMASADYPSLSTYNLIKESEFLINEEKSMQSSLEVVDCDRHLKQGVINPAAKELLQKAFKAGKRIVVIWNKKGFARGVFCSNCRHVYQCGHCSGFLQMLAVRHQALCPHCQRTISLPEVCPECRSGYFRGGSWGIERVGQAIRKIFPGMKVDDWLKRNNQSECVLATSEILSTLYEPKSFDAGIVLDADASIMRMDYDATFNAFLYFKKLALLFREKLSVFTYNRDYYLYENINSPWQEFYEKELKLRCALNLPPYGLLCKITLRSPSENLLFQSAQKLYNELNSYFSDIYGPLKLEPFKLRDQYRYSLIVKAKKTFETRKIIKEKITSFRLSNAHAAVVIE